MRSLALAILLAAPGLAAADPTPAATKPAPVKAEPPRPEAAACTRVVVGRGLERHSVCRIETPVIVKVETQRPGVIIVHDGGKKVVGPPRFTDPLVGLSHSLRD